MARRVVEGQSAPLLTAATREGVYPREAMDVLISLSNAVIREDLGLDSDQVLSTILKDMESGEYIWRGERTIKARKRKACFDKAADEYRRRYEDDGIDLTFDDAATEYKLLPWPGDEDMDQTLYRLMFNEVMEAISGKLDALGKTKKYFLSKAMGTRFASSRPSA